MLGKSLAPSVLWPQLLDPWLHPNRVATAVEPGRSPSSHLAATSTLCIPLKVASRTPQEKMWSVLTSDILNLKKKKKKRQKEEYVPNERIG